MVYQLKIDRKVEKELERIPQKDAKRIVEKLNELANDNPNLDIKKLEGVEDRYRLRVGDYRVIYRKIVEVLIIEVLDMAHRKDIYK